MRGALGLLLLLTVFFIRARIWFFFLKSFGIDVTYRLAFYSQFNTILLKYVPGKIWVPVGKANIISSNQSELLKISSIAFLQQLVFTFWGLLLGAFSIGFIWEELPMLWGVYILLSLTIILGILALSKEWRFTKQLPKFFRKLQDLYIPKLIKVLPLVVLQWALLGAAYYIMYQGMVEDISIAVAPVQVLANNIGMVAIFVPAGLGIREGISALYFSNMDIAVEVILALTITSRLWFIVGELVIFAISLFLKNLKKA